MQDKQIQSIQFLLQNNRYDAALSSCQNLLSQDPDNVGVLLLRAYALLGLKKYDEASESAERAISLAPDYAHAHFTAAIIMLERNQLAKADEHITTALQLDPADADYYHIKGAIAFEHKKWSEARDLAESGLSIDPEHEGCLNLRSSALTQLGDKKEAFVATSRALRENPESPHAHSNEGYRLLNRGDYKQARVHFQEALRLNPNSEFARQGALETLRASNPAYRIVLWYFLALSKLSARVQFGLIIGLYFLAQSIGSVVEKNPSLGYVLYPLLFAYVAFALSTWFMQPLSDSALRFSKLGRAMLRPWEVWRSNVFLLLGAVFLVFVGLTVFDSSYWMKAAITTLFVSLPSMLIFYMNTTRDRVIMAGFIVGLLGMGIAHYVYLDQLAGLIAAKAPEPVLMSLVEKMRSLGTWQTYTALGAQLIGAAMMQVRPTY